MIRALRLVPAACRVALGAMQRVAVLDEVRLLDPESSSLWSQGYIGRMGNDDHLGRRRRAWRQLAILKLSSCVSWNSGDLQEQVAVPAVLEGQTPDGPHPPDGAINVTYEVLRRSPLLVQVGALASSGLSVWLVPRSRAPGRHLLAELGQLGLPNLATQPPIRCHSVVA